MRAQNLPVTMWRGTASADIWAQTQRTFRAELRCPELPTFGSSAKVEAGQNDGPQVCTELLGAAPGRPKEHPMPGSPQQTLGWCCFIGGMPILRILCACDHTSGNHTLDLSYCQNVPGKPTGHGSDAHGSSGNEGP